jgi:flagellin-like hook-associated protein FlgL
MAISLKNNIPSLAAQRELNKGMNSISKVFERLSSGLRINRASDDAAGLAIASSLNTHSRLFTKAILNISDSISALTITQGALQELGSVLTRQSELAEQGGNSVLSLTQRQALQSESDALTAEYNRIIETTSFNGIQLLSGTGVSFSTQAGITGSDYIQQRIGAELNRTVGTASFGNATGYNLGLVDALPITTRDLNGDGYADAVLGDLAASGGALRVIVSNGDGTFAFTQSIAGVNSGSSEAAYDIQFGDVNNDGKADMVVSERSNNTVALYVGNGNGTFQARQQVQATESVKVKLADANNDGKEDLIVLTHGGLVHTSFGNGDATFRAPVSSTIGGSLDGASFADFNGDGIIDIAAAAYFNNYVSIALGRGDGTFSTSSSLASSGTSRKVESGDLNRDGKLDIVVTDFSGLTVYLANGNGSFQSGTRYAGITPDFSLELADFNNDGFTDIFSTNSLLLGNGDGTFKARLSNAFNAFGDSAVGDFNRDGVIDLLTTGYSDGYVVNLGVTKQSNSMEYLNILSASSSRATLETLNGYRERLSQELSTLGGQMSRLETATSFARMNQIELAGAASRIMDADIATESATLIRLKILQQAGSAVLAQANQQPQIALLLLK